MKYKMMIYGLAWQVAWFHGLICFLRFEIEQQIKNLPERRLTSNGFVNHDEKDNDWSNEFVEPCSMMEIGPNELFGPDTMMEIGLNELFEPCSMMEIGPNEFVELFSGIILVWWLVNVPEIESGIMIKISIINKRKEAF